MIRWVKLSIPLVALTLLVAGAVPARADRPGGNSHQAQKNKPNHKKAHSAPEFDPAAAGAIAALLAGGGLLIARRRRR